MTPTEFRRHLAALELTQGGFARLAGCTDRQVRRWAAGDAEMPQWAILIVLLLGLPGAMEIAREARWLLTRGQRRGY